MVRKRRREKGGRHKAGKDVKSTTVKEGQESKKQCHWPGWHSTGMGHPHSKPSSSCLSSEKEKEKEKGSHRARFKERMRRHLHLHRRSNSNNNNASSTSPRKLSSADNFAGIALFTLIRVCTTTFSN